MEVTTIKLLKPTKARLDNLKSYRRETYDDIIQKILDILNTCRVDPESAKRKLIKIESERKLS